MPYKFRQFLEPAIWLTALVLLFFMDTSKDSASFCVFKMVGFHSCPGCGIGHAMHDALHFRFAQSFHEHLLGIPAVLIILYTTIKSLYTLKSHKRHGSTKIIYDASRHAAG
jgi:hypothetical protein